MALPKTDYDREHEKFVECNNEVAVRTKLCQEPGETIKVDIVEDGENGEVKNVYNEIASVAASTLTSVVTYTVPAGKTFFLKHIEASGENRATFTVEINATVERKRQTYQPIFNTDFLFYNLRLSAGDIVTLRVFHTRGTAADFNGTILGNEV